MLLYASGEMGRWERECVRWLCGWKAHSGIEEGGLDEARAGWSCLLVLEVRMEWELREYAIAMLMPACASIGRSVKLDIASWISDLRSAAGFTRYSTDIDSRLISNFGYLSSILIEIPFDAQKQELSKLTFNISNSSRRHHHSTHHQNQKIRKEHDLNLTRRAQSINSKS
jgi:hypothetical protein